MKTLVIHPIDASTDFLSEIYSDKLWTIIKTNVSKKVLKEQIKAHDRIVMLGHGSEKGLFGFNKFMIDSSWVYLLREKNCVCIWCNADVFVKKYGLKGLYTGMIISEPDEALAYCQPFKWEFIDESNKLFAKSIKESIGITESLDHIKSIYNSDTNPIIQFNTQNIYEINLDN